MARTIKQFNSFSRNVEMTEEQFVDRWISHALELHKILHVDVYAGVLDLIKKGATERFEEIWVEQNSNCIHGVSFTARCEDCEADIAARKRRGGI